MITNARSLNRAHVRLMVAVLPLIFAGCATLFPPRDGMGGGSAHPAAPATTGAANTPAGAPTTPATGGKAPATLYARLGGQAGIIAFSDDFLGRVTNDPQIIPFFKGLTDADLARIRKHVIELLCSATGGGCEYTGKDMKTVHAQMEINNDIWNVFTGHLNQSVARFKIQDRERNELVVIIASLKKDIVTK